MKLYHIYTYIWHVCDAFIKLYYIYMGGVLTSFQGSGPTPYNLDSAAVAERGTFEFVLPKHPDSSVKLSIYYYVTRIQ